MKEVPLFDLRKVTTVTLGQHVIYHKGIVKLRYSSSALEHLLPRKVA